MPQAMRLEAIVTRDGCSSQIRVVQSLDPLIRRGADTPLLSAYVAPVDGFDTHARPRNRETPDTGDAATGSREHA